MTTATIRTIKILDGARLAVAFRDDTDERVVHGLGVVGDPILPYLGHRSEGYALEFDNIPPVVLHVDTGAAPDALGYYPTTPTRWAGLEAPDLPTLTEFANRNK